MPQNQSKILFVTTHLPPDFNFGGVVYSGHGLLSYLASTGKFQIDAYATSPNPEQVIEYCRALNIRSLVIDKSRFLCRHGFSGIFGFLNLFRLFLYSNIVICNGIFTYPVTITLFLGLFSSKRIYFMTRGGLSKVRVNNSGTIKKIIYSKFLNLLLVKNNVKIVFSGLNEYDDARHFVNARESQTIYAPNGFTFRPDTNFSPKPPPPEDEKLTVTFLSRISPEKGIDLLGKAFKNKQIQQIFDLEIYGPIEVNGLLESSDLDIYYRGEIYGEEKNLVYLNTDVFILPSHNENFGNVVVEFLHRGIPVITTDQTFFVKFKDQFDFLKIIKCDSSDIINCLVELSLQIRKGIYSNPHKFKDMQQFVREEFNWKKMTSELINELRA